MTNDEKMDPFLWMRTNEKIDGWVDSGLLGANLFVSAFQIIILVETDNNAN